MTTVPRPRPTDGPRRLGALAATAALTAFALPALVAPPARAATTFVVSPVGDDSAAGTADAPLRTLGTAFERLRAGDTLVVRGGTYVEQVRVTAARGTAAAPIRVVAADGERPVLSGLLWLKDADHWTLDGLNVTWGASNTRKQHLVKLTGGTGWRITNAEIWGARSYAAILVAGTPRDWSIDHNHVHHTYKSNGTNQDHLIYVNGGMGGGVIERNVLAHSPNGRGLKVGPPSGGSRAIGNLVVRYNTFLDNQGPSNVQLSYGASNVEIYRNVFDLSGRGSANVMAYKLKGTGNKAWDNVGWRSAGVVDDDPRIADLGGNVMVDPQLSAGGFPTAATHRLFPTYGVLGSDVATRAH